MASDLEDTHIITLTRPAAIFALWHPKAYKYYKTNLDKLWEMHPEIAKLLFPRSIFPVLRLMNKRKINCLYSCSVLSKLIYDVCQSSNLSV